MPRGPAPSLTSSRSPESRLDSISRRILDCSQRVRDDLGADRRLEDYESALDRLMRIDQLQFARQYPFGMDFLHPDESGFRADFVVDGWILVELRAVPGLLPEHTAEAREYLRISHCKVCLLINFGRQPVEFHQLAPETETKP